MSPYDEAMIKLNHGMEFGMTYGQRDDILEALERAKKVEELLKQYQVLAHDYEVLSNNKDGTKLGLLIFAVEEGKRIIKQLEEKLK